MTISSAFHVVIALCIISVVNCINITEWEEGQCSRIPRLVVESLESDFSMSNEISDDVVWYTPMYSKYELYKTASLVSGIPVKDLTEDDIKRSCLVTKQTPGGGASTEGFGGRKVDFVIAPGKHGGYLWKVKGDRKYRGEFWITLIGKNFMVSVTCWANGHVSFSASSNEKSFDSETRDRIVKHVTSLGFDQKNIYDYSYEGCKDVKQNYY